MILCTLCLVSNALTYNVCIQSKPLKCGTPVFRKVDRFSSPNSTWTILIMWTLIYCFHKIVRHLLWIQRPGIILAMLFIVLMFLNITRQWKGPKVRPLRAQQPENPLPHLQYTRSLWNTNTSIFRTHRSVPSGVRFRGVPLYLTGSPFSIQTWRDASLMSG